jgi:serine O-acetyltransferase
MTTCESWLSRLRAVLRTMSEDVRTVRQKDPAARSNCEVLLYPHIHALWIYRVAHRRWLRGRRFSARALSLFARCVSGIEIHPGAHIGRRFFIDHGTAVVIGETVRIGDDVMLYHQVTLGSVGWWKDLRRPAGARRHPVVEDGVIIGAGASVLGPITVGAGARVGAHAVVMDDVPPNGRVSPPRSSPTATTATCEEPGTPAMQVPSPATAGGSVSPP